MYSQTVRIKNKTGLHARPATLFTQMAAKFQSTISVTNNERTVDAKSILKVLSLGIGQNAEVLIAAEGSDERSAVDTLVELIATKLGE